MREAMPAYDRLQDELARATEGVGAARILDLGAGTGETARRVLDRHPGAHVVALDASVADARARGSAPRRPGHAAPRARLGEPLPDGPFDLVVSALAVHHLDGPGKAALFAEVGARLAPGGRFVMADVVVPDAPVARPTPIDPAVDLPDRAARPARLARGRRPGAVGPAGPRATSPWSPRPAASRSAARTPASRAPRRRPPRAAAPRRSGRWRPPIAVQPAACAALMSSGVSPMT